VPNKLVPIDFKSSGTIWFKRLPIINYKKLNEPINARFVGGGFFFTIGQHSQEYKYDPHLYFAGDELSLSLRSYTMGYDLYHPHKNILWHFYQRHNRVKHWNDHNKKNSKTKTVWWETDKISKQRLNKLISGGNLENYGCGSVRSIHDYEKYSGFDFDKKRILLKARNGYDPPLEYNEESFKTNQKIIIDWQDINIGTYEIKLIHLSKKYITQNIDTDTKEIYINTDNPIMKYEILKDNKVILSKELYNNIVWH
jgi:hypothetical protein